MTFEFTSPNRIVYKKGNITKLDVANYYNDISSKILPYIKNRLLSVIRCHQGVDGQKFFKKHPNTEGEFVEIFKVGDDDYFYLKNVSQLLYQVQLGTIEFHAWGSQVKSINKPDLMTFDLDPSEGLTLNKIRQGALDLKNVLEELGLKTYLKTSGGKGYHVVVHKKFKDWESYNTFAKSVANFMENKWPRLYTSNIRKSERKNKIFIDYLRNAKGATCVAPYSLRARDNASISFPISWNNLNEIKPNEVTFKNYNSYLTKTDPWQDFSILQENHI